MKKTIRIVAALLALLTVLSSLGIFISSADETPENLINGVKFTESSYYKAGKKLGSQKFKVSDEIDISGIETLYAGVLPLDRNTGIPYFEFFTKDGEFLSDAFASDVTTDESSSKYFGTVSVKVPEGAGKVRVNLSAQSDLPTVVTTSPFTYEEFKAMTGYEKDIIRKDSPLYGKKILFCGDSICEAYVEKTDARYSQIAGWAGRIGTYNNMDYVNKGLGGAAFSFYNPEKNPTYLILTQLKAFESTADSFDLVLLHGGVNDMWDKVPIGEISESRNPEDFDMKTFAGAMEATFCYAKEHYTNAAIGFVINFQTHSSWGYLNNYMMMMKYWDTAKKICKKWDIPYLDMYNEQPFKSMTIPTDHGGDGIHPIYEGYEMLYPHIEAFVETLVPLIPVTTPEPTETAVPGTTTPLASESAAITEDTVVAETPETTKAPESAKTEESKKSSIVLPIVLGSVALLAVAGVVAGIVISKKKKK